MKELFSISNYYFNVHSLLYFVSGILILAESIFIFLQNKKSVVNFSFSLCTFFASLWLSGMAIIYSCLSQPLAIIWARYYCWLGIIFVTPAVYMLSVAWEKGRLEKKIKITYFNFATAAVIYLICITSEYIVEGVWSYQWGFYPKAGPGEGLLIIWFYILMLLSFRNFIQSYKREKIPIRKKQTRLVIIAFVFGFLGSLDFLPNFDIPLYPFGGFPVAIFSSVVAYNIVSYKLMDIETVLHKTALWLLSFFLIIIPIFFFYQQLFPLIEKSMPLQFWFWLLSFLLFTTYLRVIQPRIDHFFQRRKANLDNISSRFTQDLTHLKGLNQLIQRIEKTIADTLYPQRTDIFIYNEKEKKYELENRPGKEEFAQLKRNNKFLLWLGENDKIVHKDFIEIDPALASARREAKEYFNLSEAAMVIPLVLNEQLIGLINLTKKVNLKPYRGAEFNFLTTLKNQSAIAIANSLLYENIEEQVRGKTKELVDVQKQLIQAEKLATMGILAGGVAHEINNPLTAILTNVQMLLVSQDELDLEETKESLELIEEATKRCRTIVKKLMTYARKPLEPSAIIKINLLDLVKKVDAFLGYQLKQENIKIIIEAKDNAYFVMGNQNELEQVVTNIVLNGKDAIKRAKGSGTIRILLSKNDNWIKLDIKDEGRGIPKDQIPKIFDPFFTTKGVGEGLGLGLSISQSIIEKYQGSIFLQTEENKGTTFVVNLPNAD